VIDIEGGKTLMEESKSGYVCGNQLSELRVALMVQMSFFL
jgi:hypothetical protein